jgi:hypothetical protein
LCFLTWSCDFLQIGDGYTPPRVFFVRAANKGLMLDAASRKNGRGKVDPSTALPSQLRVNRASSPELKGKGKGSEKDNAETERAQRWRGDDEVVGKCQRLRFTRHGSAIVTDCQYIFSVYRIVIRTTVVHSNWRGGSSGIKRSWQGS